MSPTTEKTAAFVALAVQVLTPDERVAVAHELLDTAADEDDEFVLTDAMKAELERRLTLHRANPDAGIPWEDVIAGTEARARARAAARAEGRE